MPSGADVDLYRVLGVARDATAAEIRRAYRRLAREHHPDLNPHPDGQHRFARLAHAYEILHDPVQRAHYDTALVRATAAPPQTTVHRPTWSVLDHGPAVCRGVLELSPGEAAHLARHPLPLHDGRGRTIVLPAGTGDGDHIVAHLGGSAVLLTVCVHRRT